MHPLRVDNISTDFGSGRTVSKRGAACSTVDLMCELGKLVCSLGQHIGRRSMVNGFVKVVREYSKKQGVHVLHVLLLSFHPLIGLSLSPISLASGLSGPRVWNVYKRSGQ